MDANEVINYIGLGAWILSHVVAVVGVPSWFPNWMVALIQRISANYGKAANK